MSVDKEQHLISQYPTMTKIQKKKKTGTKGTYVNIIKDSYVKIAAITFSLILLQDQVKNKVCFIIQHSIIQHSTETPT